MTEQEPNDLQWRPFPANVLPEPIRGFVTEAAAALGCDVSFVALPTLSALAAAIGNARRIELKASWREPCVFWTAVVGDSGSLKSPALGLATAELRRLQSEALDAHESQMKTHEQFALLHEADLAAWKRTGRKNAEPPPEPPEEPKPARYLTTDTTIEALVDRLADNPRGILLARDELAGWLTSFDQYKGGRGGDCSHWLSMFRAEPILTDRKSGDRRITHVERAAVSICGTIQPAILARTLSREHFEDELAARFLLAMPPALPKQWNESTVSTATLAAVETLYCRLLALDFDGEPVDVPLSGDGKRAWVAFYNAHAKQTASTAGDLKAAYSKLEAYCARLALLVHVVRQASGEPIRQVDAASVEAAATLVGWFGHETHRIYATLSQTDEERERNQLIGWIHTSRPAGPVRWQHRAG